jgi:hypothetical protein
MPEWITFPVMKEVVLFLVAVYGAVLSTFNWRQAVKKDRRNIKVVASSAVPTLESGALGPCFAKVEAVNVGHRPVTITALTFELPTGGRLATFAPDGLPGAPDTRLPATLADGQSAHVFMSYREIAIALLKSGRGKTRLTPVCDDSAGGTYRGDPWNVDPNEWQSM